MSVSPEISVVMSVFNAAPTLEATLDSVLSQQGVELEFIVVNDGSSDGSGEILDRCAQRDPRLRVIHQANAGLTLSLQRACDRARGGLIARQDAGGDTSLANRLSIQSRLLLESRSAVFATCAHRLVCDDGTFLCDVRISKAEIEQGLSPQRLQGLRGIPHASSMFRADAFRAVGGYRQQFKVAQDIDLWLRLFERGDCVVASQVLYECRHEVNGISATRRAEQMALAEYAWRCARARRAGVPEPAPLDFEVSEMQADSRSRQLSDYHYFVASCLRHRDPGRARRHFMKAWRSEPKRVKALLSAVLTW